MFYQLSLWKDDNKLFDGVKVTSEHLIDLFLDDRIISNIYIDLYCKQLTAKSALRLREFSLLVACNKGPSNLLS